MFDDQWDDDEYYFYEFQEQVERKERRDSYKKELSLVSDDLLLLKYEVEARYSEKINNIVPKKSFPAFDIAFFLKKNNKKPTFKQRAALENVLAVYYSDNRRS